MRPGPLSICNHFTLTQYHSTEYTLPMSRFFTSDLHIRHDLVCKIRGFTTPDGEADHEAHEASIRKAWESRVHPDNIVFILGDIAINPRKGAFEFLDSLPGRKVLIAGNHDEVASFHSKASKAQREWLEHFESIHDFLRIKIAGTEILLSHYPYSGEGERDQADRYTQYRLRDEGRLLLHGHTHSTNAITSANQIHVGWDAWGKPVSENIIAHAWGLVPTLS